MSVWDELVGQHELIGQLQAAATCVPPQRPAHAWLFTGPPGSGRSVAARAFAAALQCDQGGCGTCQACRTVLAGTHPDLTVVSTEKLRIHIAQVRELVSIAQRHPSQGRWRTILIEDADRMEERTGNVLLKAVEEPPPHTIWLMCAPSSHDVLVTLRSRCRVARLVIPSVDEVTALLVSRDGVDPTMAANAAKAAQSHIGVARRLALDPEARQRRRTIVRLALDCPNEVVAMSNAGRIMDIAEAEAESSMGERNARDIADLRRNLGIEPDGPIPANVRSQFTALDKEHKGRVTRFRRDMIDRSLQDLSTVFRDILMVQVGYDTHLVNEAERDGIEHMARTSTPEASVRKLDAIRVARRRLEANVAPLLALEALAVHLT